MNMWLFSLITRIFLFHLIRRNTTTREIMYVLITNYLLLILGATIIFNNLIILKKIKKKLNLQWAKVARNRNWNAVMNQTTKVFKPGVHLVLFILQLDSDLVFFIIPLFLVFLICLLSLREGPGILILCLSGCCILKLSELFFLGLS